MLSKIRIGHEERNSELGTRDEAMDYCGSTGAAGIDRARLLAIQTPTCVGGPA